LHEITSGTAAWLDSFLLARLRGTPEELYSSASHLISHGGKRLRPYLVLACCRLAGGRAGQAMAAAAAVEMVHNFTLIHDDIMDHDVTRHGVPTVHTKYGTATGILAGDLLFAKAFDLLSARNGRRAKAGGLALVARLSEACRDLCEGQMLDIAMSRSGALPSEKQYVTMIQKKTASLFEASCALGAMCAGADQGMVKKVSLFGRNLGMAFQLIDDLIDVTAGPLRAPHDAGNDLREGKKTLPIMLAIRRARGRARREILGTLGNPAASDDAVACASRAIVALGVDGDVRRKAAAYARAARGALRPIDTPTARELAALAGAVVERQE
jgi:geranylgeranyl diphosphate synthase type I